MEQADTENLINRMILRALKLLEEAERGNMHVKGLRWDEVPASGIKTENTRLCTVCIKGLNLKGIKAEPFSAHSPAFWVSLVSARHKPEEDNSTLTVKYPPQT